MMKTMSKRAQADLGMLLVAFIWGSTFVITKNALADIGPFLFLGIRFILAFLVLALFSFRQTFQLNRPILKAGSLIGFFLFIGYVFQTIGLQYTTSSNAGFITGLSVVLVPVLYFIVNRRVPRLSIIISVILAAAGLFFMSVQPGSFHPAYGDLLVLVCAFGFALQILLVDRYSYQFNAVAITGVQILFVGLLCLAIGLIVEPWPEHFPFHVTSAIIITAVFATTMAFLLQNGMQKYSTPTRFAVVLTMEPVFAGLTGYLWANEVLGVRALAGAGMILAAMLIAILTRKV